MKKLMTITLLLLPLSALAQKPTIDDSQLKALTTTIGGANVLPTTRTIPHWWGSTLDPHNGVTYGYSMAYPQDQTGLVAGIGAGSWSAAVAMVLPTLGNMFDQKHFANAFLFVGIVPVLGAISWWGLTLPRSEGENQQKGRLGGSHRGAL